MTSNLSLDTRINRIEANKSGQRNIEETKMTSLQMEKVNSLTENVKTMHEDMKTMQAAFIDFMKMQT